MKYRLLCCLLAALSLNAQGAQPAKTGPEEWAHEYQRGDVVPCGDDEKENCIWQRLIVDNQSDDTLECSGQLTYDGANRAQQTAVDHKMVIMPHTRRAVINDSTKPEVNATAHSVQCTIRKPLDNSKLTPQCKPTILNGPPTLNYPPASRRAGEEGTVLVEFSLSDELGHPTDIVAVGSSLWPALDKSGVEYVSQFNGATACKHGRFRIPVTFQLK